MTDAPRLDHVQVSLSQIRQTLARAHDETQQISVDDGTHAGVALVLQAVEQLTDLVGLLALAVSPPIGE